MTVWALKYFGFPAMLAVASAAGAQVTPQSSVTQNYQGYVLGINDEIEVTILNSNQPQKFKSRVKEDGTVTVPFIGALTANGRTARQLALEITDALRTRQIFSSPVIGVEITEFVSNTATIFGEVSTPGLYPLDRTLTVGAMMARAGGTRGNAADYLILKRSGEEHKILLNTLSGEWSNGTELLKGDELFVPSSPVIYIYGQVQSGGSYAIKSNSTVRQMLARAGGVTLSGSQKNITLHHDGKKYKKVDLEHVLEDGDILYINEKLF